MGTAGIVAVCAVAALQGWVWAVFAWFGGSLVAFAVATAAAHRRALAGEKDERRLLFEQSENGDDVAPTGMGQSPADHAAA
jgi:hypothetical protein